MKLKQTFLLPLKFLYLQICIVFFFLSTLFLKVKKRKPNNTLDPHSILILASVALSCDGRIKKNANILSQRGMNVTLLKPYDACEIEGLELQGLDPSVQIIKKGLSGVFTHFPYCFDLCMFLNVLGSKAKYIYCHNVMTAFMGLVASKLSGKTLVCDFGEWMSQTVDFKNNKAIPLKRLKRTIFQYIEYQVLKHANHVIAVSQLVADKLCQTYNIKRDLLILQNIPEIKPLEPYNLRENLSIPPYKTILFYIGQLGFHRNIDNIIYAISNIQNVVLVLQGTLPTDVEHFLKNLIKDLKLENQVFILPPVSHERVPSACQGADIGLLTYQALQPNLLYTLPNKLFEYTIGEIPIIVEDTPAVRPYIENHQIGLLINSLDIKQIRNAIRMYTNNKELFNTHKNNVIAYKAKLVSDNSIQAVYDAFLN